MSGTITDFFGYRADDVSEIALLAAAQTQCPFIHQPCIKTLGRDEETTRSGACAIQQVKSPSSVICCPIRLYADDYRILHLVSERTFGKKYGLYAGRVAIKKAVDEGGAVAVFGHRWGGELRLPKRNGVGNYFADWVLALLDDQGQIKEFTSIEVQTIDTTGNYRPSRSALLENRTIARSTVGLNWENVSKRIIPQLVYKGQVLQREKLCKSGLWFVTPEPVYQRILSRLGGSDNIAFGYTSQPGALHFLRYDYDTDGVLEDGVPTSLTVIDDECTTVEQLQSAFNRIRLPEAGVYEEALVRALYD